MAGFIDCQWLLGYRQENMNDENQDDENNSEVVIAAPNVQHDKPEAGKPGVIYRRDCSADLFLFVHARSTLNPPCGPRLKT